MIDDFILGIIRWIIEHWVVIFASLISAAFFIVHVFNRSNRNQLVAGIKDTRIKIRDNTHTHL